MQQMLQLEWKKCLLHDLHRGENVFCVLILQQRIQTSEIHIRARTLENGLESLDSDILKMKGEGNMGGNMNVSFGSVGVD